jgi:hypothetical protein
MPNIIFRQGPPNPPLGSKSRIHDPPARTVYQVIQEKLLVVIETRMSESTTHPKPPTIRLHPDGYKYA